MLVFFLKVRGHNFPICVVFITIRVGDGPGADACAAEGAAVVAKAVVGLRGIAGGLA